MKEIKPIHKRILMIVFLFLLSCKDFVTIAPSIDQIGINQVYGSDETATAAIRGIYAKLMYATGFASGGIGSVTLYAGWSADEFVNQSSTLAYKQFSDNNLIAENSSLRSGLWQEPYSVIYAINTVLENLDKSDQVSLSVKKQLAGEAKFIRALCYFYLCNLFGEVPLILTTNYRVNTVAFANTREQIFGQIIQDLHEAKNTLPEEYISTERIRVNKWAAAALLARVYLYDKQWKKAEVETTEIIIQEEKYKLSAELNQVFLKNSQETILQLVVPTTLGLNTREGSIFILNAAPTGTTARATLSPELIAAFEPGDQRLLKWVGTFTAGSKSWLYPFKYKIKAGSTPLNEYSMVLRLAEQYLIRSEACINQDKIEEGIKDLNVLRKRSRSLPTILVPDPLPDLSLTMSKEQALLSVEKERRIELFSEWGHRWLDLKRTNRADAVLAPIKGVNWQETDVLYPIPATELLNAVNLKQNPGYN